jgi:VanZ family protein
LIDEIEVRGGRADWVNALWVYGPLVAWLVFIYLASTDAFSAKHTASILEPILRWFDPGISRAKIRSIHFVVRKAGHFCEYGILAVFAARAFRWTRGLGFYKHWALWAIALVAVYSLTDEFHQSFVSSRTASIYDSMIDTAGGLTGLLVAWLWSRRRKPGGERENGEDD